MSAIRSRIRTGAGVLAAAAEVSLDELRRIVAKINGRLSLGDGTSGSWAGNLDAQDIDVTFPSVADTEVEVPHGLERTPVGVVAFSLDRAGHVYDSRRGSWDATRLFLKCSTASAVTKVKVW
jgi:hypothetical protein